MATLKFNGVGIKATAACVPPGKAYNKDLVYLMPEEEVAKVIDSVGIRERRIAEAEVTASDLCLKAAQQLMERNHIDAESIDMLLFLSQTPDYKIPATAPILQHRLGLPKTTAALDLSLGCSGYVYALSTAFAYASVQGIDRVLLLVGETFSKIVDPRDKVNVPLYGDAGTATLVEKGEQWGSSVFMLHSDGEKAGAVRIEKGAYRHWPLTADDLEVREQEEGNYRSAVEIYMDGMEVFNFALSVVPKSIKATLAEAGVEIGTVDRIVLHQANKFMTDFFIKKLKYPPEKVPYCLDRYGNTSSASVPLTLCSELSHVPSSELRQVILCGFGAGLSWGTVLTDLSQTWISETVDY